MNRREFIKSFGYTAAGATLFPLGLKLIAGSELPENPFRIGDAIIFPGSFSVGWGAYAVLEIRADGRMTIISMLVDEKIVPEKKGDVFLHVYRPIAEETVGDPRPYAHEEERYTHHMYELTEDPIVDYIDKRITFNYKQCKFDEHGI